MTGYEAVRTSYDALAERYAEEIGDELIGKPVDRALYGCFAGLGLPVIGVDISPGMVRVARLRHPHLRFEVGTFAGLPAADGEWAGAVAPYSIIHLDRDARRAAFAELGRAVVAGGWLLVSFHIS